MHLQKKEFDVIMIKIGDDRMKCVAIKGEKQFEVKEIEEPKKQDGKVMVHIEKVGICGSDIHYWESGNPQGLIMGHEYCATVIDPIRLNETSSSSQTLSNILFPSTFNFAFNVPGTGSYPE